MAQYKAAGFYQRFESEMEAFAHYVRVFVDFNGPGTKSTNLLRSNRAWIARIPMENLVHHGTNASGRRYFQFPVDRDTEHVVKVNERDYEKLKNMYWFVKDGRITGVQGCYKVGTKYHFDYEFLDLMIYRTMTGKLLKIGKPIKLDGDEFNLVRRNLAPPPKEEEHGFDVCKTGLFGPVPDPRQEERDSWEEESWLASLGQSYGKTSDQPSWGDEIAMPGERSEPGL